MANPIVITDASLVLNSVDLAASVKKVTLDMNGDVHDVSAMGSDWKASEAGALGGTLSIEFWNDYDASKVDATLWAAFIGRAAVTFTTKAVSGTATGAGNPEYQGSCIVNATSPGGSYNAPAEISVSFPITGTVTRAVA